MPALAQSPSGPADQVSDPTRFSMKNDPSGNPAGFLLFGPDYASVWRSLSWHLGFMFAFSTLAGLLIALITNSWSNVTLFLPTDVMTSYCIGLSIFVVLTAARLTFLLRFQSGNIVRRIVYFALVTVGALVGNKLSHILITRPQGLDYGRGHDAAIAVVITFIAATIALEINASRLAREQHKRDLERAERTAIEAQLRALQAQIEPHFLFNTLANLDALIAIDATRARTLLANLIRYLRAALTHARSDSATLQTEMELLKAYLGIMALRLPNRLTTEFDCDPECLRLGFPAMLVQPLVENAITHGIEPAPEGGTISVSVQRAGETLVISVDDTGVGLGNATTAGTGAGIQNIRARLRSLFGEAAQLTLEARAPHGTHAGIQVPLKLLSVVGG
jgi:sensor histidine kinase YesM